MDGLPVDNLIGDGFAGQQFGCRWVAGLPTWSTIWLLTPVLVCQGANLALKGQQFGCRPLSGLLICQTNSYTGNKTDKSNGYST